MTTTEMIGVASTALASPILYTRVRQWLSIRRDYASQREDTAIESYDNVVELARKFREEIADVALSTSKLLKRIEELEAENAKLRNRIKYRQ